MSDFVRFNSNLKDWENSFIDDLAKYITHQLMLKESVFDNQSLCTDRILFDFGNANRSFCTDMDEKGIVNFSCSLLLPKLLKTKKVEEEMNEPLPYQNIFDVVVIRENVTAHIVNTFMSIERFYKGMVNDLSIPHIVNVRIDDEKNYVLVSFDGRCFIVNS